MFHYLICIMCSDFENFRRFSMSELVLNSELNICLTAMIQTKTSQLHLAMAAWWESCSIVSIYKGRPSHSQPRHIQKYPDMKFNPLILSFLHLHQLLPHFSICSFEKKLGLCLELMPLSISKCTQKIKFQELIFYAY